jgi:hypothetical protein
MTEDDWRLSLGEQEWMYGAKLERRVFTPPTPDWDHEHCALCNEKFMEAPYEALHEGYDERVAQHPEAPDGFRSSVSAPTREAWICETCFVDFRERFAWTAVASQS